MEDLVSKLGKSSGKTRKDIQPDDVVKSNWQVVSFRLVEVIRFIFYVIEILKLQIYIGIYIEI